MKLAFITSLRSPENSTDYANVELLLRETLASILGQTNQDFIVIVVGNRAPSFALPRNVQFVLVDFPAPVGSSGPHASREAFVTDKGSKIAVGLLAARAYSPEWVMIFDADDFVSRSIVDFVNQNPTSSGWVLTKGYMYSRARAVVRRIDNFNTTCGTCFIVPFNAYDLPAELDVSSSQTEIVARFGEMLRRILGAHRDALAWFRSDGRDIQPLPFRGAVYHVDTGENHSMMALRGVARPLTPRFSRAFGITPRLSTYAILSSAVSPKAIQFSLADYARRVIRRLGLADRTSQ